MDGTTPPREPWGRRWASLLVVVAGLLAVKVFHSGPGIHADGVGYHLWTYAILKGDAAFSWLPDTGGAKYLMQPDTTQRRYACKYPPGVALVRLPLMAFVVDPDRNGPPYSKNEHRLCLVVSALALLAVAGLCLLVCERLGVSALHRHGAVVVLTFGTGLFHHATFDAAASHIYSALGAAALLWIAVVAVQDRAGRLPLILTQFILFLLVLVRNTNVIMIAFWSLGLFAWGWNRGLRSMGVWLRNAAIVASTVASGVAIQLAINYNAFGRLQLSSYGQESFDFSRCMLGEVMFSYERGLFTYYPICLVALLAGFLTRQTRRLTLGVTLLVLAYGTLYGFWHNWKLGHGFGHRGFVDMVPFLVPVLALALNRLSDVWRRLILSCSVPAVALTLLVMVGYWTEQYPHIGATQFDYCNAITLRCYRDAVGRRWERRPPEDRPDAPAPSPDRVAASTDGDETDGAPEHRSLR
jgi:hypothetical protein